MKEKTLKIILYVIGGTILTIVASVFYQELVGRLDLNLFKQYIQSLGFWGPLIFIILTSFTTILPPFPVVPFWLIAIAVFEPVTAFITIYLSSIFGHLINFLIARYLGKPVVKKFVSQRGMKRIETFPNFSDFKFFLLIRTIGTGLSDYISYAAGFTKITLFNYLVATVVGLLPIVILGYVIMAFGISIEFLAALGSFGLFYLINYAISLLVPVIIYRHAKVNMKRES